LFLSEAALRHPRVRREIGLLLWRRALGSHVRIIPVLLDGLRPGKTGITDFSELEPIEFTPSPADPGNAVETTVRKILDQVAAVPDSADEGDKMRDWIGRIADAMAELTQAGPLVSAATALEMHAEELEMARVPVQGIHFLAHQMLGNRLVGKLGAVIDAVGPRLSDEKLRRLIDEVKPAWIDPEAARLLLPPPGGPDRLLILLNAVLPVTAEQYIERAICCALRGYRYASIGGERRGEEDPFEFPGQHMDTLRALFQIPKPFPLTEPRGPNRYFLIVKAEPRHLAKAAAMARSMQDQFRQLIVILLTGSVTPGRGQLDELEGLESGTCIQVVPELGDGEEILGYQLGDDLDMLYEKLWKNRGAMRNA
jgi:hypothetical protein